MEGNGRRLQFKKKGGSKKEKRHNSTRPETVGFSGPTAKKGPERTKQWFNIHYRGQDAIMEKQRGINMRLREKQRGINTRLRRQDRNLNKRMRRLRWLVDQEGESSGKPYVDTAEDLEEEEEGEVDTKETVGFSRPTAKKGPERTEQWFNILYRGQDAFMEEQRGTNTRLRCQDKKLNKIMRWLRWLVDREGERSGQPYVDTAKDLEEDTEEEEEGEEDIEETVGFSRPTAKKGPERTEQWFNILFRSQDTIMEEQRGIDTRFRRQDRKDKKIMRWLRWLVHRVGERSGQPYVDTAGDLEEDTEEEEEGEEDLHDLAQDDDDNGEDTEAQYPEEPDVDDD